MAMVRRALIAVVAVLLVLDAAALAIVKFSGSEPPSREKDKLVVWADDPDDVEHVSSYFESQGYEPIVKEASRKALVEADYRVAVGPQKPELLDSIATVLKQSGHTELSYSRDKTYLYYGGFHTQKADANRVAERIRNQEHIGFQVVRGEKEIDKPSTRIILLEVPRNRADGLYAWADKLKEEGRVAEIEREQLETEDHEDDSLDLEE